MRKKLLELGQLDTSLKIRRIGDHVLFPILGPLPLELDVDYGHALLEEDFEEKKVEGGDYRKAVKVPDELMQLLPTSFDVVGDIVIIRLPADLLPYKGQIGEALLLTFPRLRTVALDCGVKGEMRVRDLEVIAGDASTETLHTEYGLKLRIDPSKAYFNPRLASERMRIASLVREGETVIDMFAGVGPFSLMISKYARPTAVFSIDVNPDAVEMLKANVALNRASNVFPVWGDAREVLPTLPMADRIVMNLPHSALEFLNDALARLKRHGVVHLYFVSERSTADETTESAKASASQSGMTVEVEKSGELKTYSPSTSVFFADLVLVDRV